MPLSHFVPVYPSPSPCPQVHSLHLRLHSCPAPRFFRNFFFFFKIPYVCVSIRYLFFSFIFFLFLFFNFIATLFIYFFIFGCVGSSVRARALPSYGKRGPLFIAVQGPLFIAVRGPLTIAAPPVAGHRLQTRRPSSRGSRAQSLRGMWDPPRPGLEPASPALAGRPSTTAPPGKPFSFIFILSYFHE